MTALVWPPCTTEVTDGLCAFPCFAVPHSVIRHQRVEHSSTVPRARATCATRVYASTQQLQLGSPRRRSLKWSLPEPGLSHLFKPKPKKRKATKRKTKTEGGVERGHVPAPALWSWRLFMLLCCLPSFDLSLSYSARKTLHIIMRRQWVRLGFDPRMFYCTRISITTTVVSALKNCYI
jgi:hypothetical protein